MSATQAITIVESPSASSSEGRLSGVGAPLVRNSTKTRRNVVSLIPPRTAPVVGRSADPTDPAPGEGSRPCAALLSRLFELGRLTKSLAKYFEGLSTAHFAQSQTIQSLSSFFPPSLNTSLFLPAVSSAENPTALAWANLLAHLNEVSLEQANDHAKFAKALGNDLVPALNQLHTEIQVQATQLDAEVNGLADKVVRDRATYVELQTTLLKSLMATKTAPGGLDPFIARVGTELQGIRKVVDENTLLMSSLEWQEKARELETGVNEKLKACMTTWEAASVELFSKGLLLASNTGSKVGAIKPTAEWDHFKSLHQLLSPDTLKQDVTKIEYVGRDDEATGSVKRGTLERKKRFVQNWKKAYFVLTSSGYLHEYPSLDSPLDKPHISLFLPNCTIGPIFEHAYDPRDAAAPPPTESLAELADAVKAAAATPAGSAPKAVEELPTFKFLLEGRRSVTGNIGIGHSELTRYLRAGTREEVETWREEILKFTKIGQSGASFTMFRKGSNLEEDVVGPTEKVEGEVLADDKKVPTAPAEIASLTSSLMYDSSNAGAVPPPQNQSLLAKARSIRLPKGMGRKKKAVAPEVVPTTVAAEITSPVAAPAPISTPPNEVSSLPKEPGSPVPIAVPSRSSSLGATVPVPIDVPQPDDAPSPPVAGPSLLGA